MTAPPRAARVTIELDDVPGVLGDWVLAVAPGADPLMPDTRLHAIDPSGLLHVAGTRHQLESWAVALVARLLIHEMTTAGIDPAGDTQEGDHDGQE